MELREIDHETGETRIYREHSDGTYSIEYAQDLTAILDANTRQLNETAAGFKRKEEWRHTRRIPLLWLMKVRNEDGLDFMNPEHYKEIQRRYLNDPAYNKFKVHPGRT